MAALKKISTGVPGLDEMLQGGLVEGRPYAVTGGPGSGKTIFGMQFLMEGVKNNERGLYIALEEQSKELKENMSVFGWDLRRIKIVDTTQETESGLWTIKTDTIVSRPEFTLKNLLSVMQENVETLKPSRIVVDSITTIRMLYKEQTDSRKELLALMNFLTRTGTTSLLTVESRNDENTMEEFLAAGVIRLHRIEKRGERVYAVSVEKMRGTNFDHHVRPFKVTDKGMTVFPNETIFQDVD
ncbi:Circadian clock protein kinase KaiC [uncultured archaeon]|nr:Circadian clock protein kinase KaiC [uncultured archaeon]